MITTRRHLLSGVSALAITAVLPASLVPAAPVAPADEDLFSKLCAALDRLRAETQMPLAWGPDDDDFLLMLQILWHMVRMSPAELEYFRIYLESPHIRVGMSGDILAIHYGGSWHPWQFTPAAENRALA